MRLSRRFAIAAAIGAVVLPAGAGAAQAWPKECRYEKVDNRTSMAYCKSGTGWFRAALYCKDSNGNYVYHPGKTAGTGTDWAKPGQYSFAYCSGDQTFGFAGIESKN
jgi:hypothetical protein